MGDILQVRWLDRRWPWRNLQQGGLDRKTHGVRPAAHFQGAFDSGRTGWRKPSVPFRSLAASRFFFQIRDDVAKDYRPQNRPRPICWCSILAGERFLLRYSMLAQTQQWPCHLLRTAAAASSPSETLPAEKDMELSNNLWARPCKTYLEFMPNLVLKPKPMSFIEFLYLEHGF